MNRLAQLGITVPHRASNGWHAVMQALQDASRGRATFNEDDVIETCREVVKEADAIMAQVGQKGTRRPGRPPAALNAEDLARLRSEGLSTRKIAGAMGTNRETIRRRLKGTK